MIRTIKGAYREIKAKDPNSEITIYAIRKMVQLGKIPSIRSGKKILIDVNNVYKYINGKL